MYGGDDDDDDNDEEEEEEEEEDESGNANPARALGGQVGLDFLRLLRWKKRRNCQHLLLWHLARFSLDSARTVNSDCRGTQCQDQGAARSGSQPIHQIHQNFPPWNHCKDFPSVIQGSLKGWRVFWLWPRDQGVATVSLQALKGSWPS